MTSKCEQALTGLFLCLKEGLSKTGPQAVPGVEILRNEVLPAKIPAGGLVIVRDGESGDREITLSPPLYHYQHHAEVEL